MIKIDCETERMNCINYLSAAKKTARDENIISIISLINTSMNEIEKVFDKVANWIQDVFEELGSNE